MLRSKLINEYWLFIACLLFGLILIYFTLPMAEGYKFSNGKELLAFYVPLPVSMSFLIYSAWKQTLSRKTILYALLLFLLLIIPFYSFLLETYEHYSRDDGFRYRIMANNIAQNNTLWGSDDLVYNTSRKVYLFQPGDRYYLAVWIGIFGEEKRLFQFFNMLLYFSSIAMLLSCIQTKLKKGFIEKGVLLFFVLSSPFVVKNILMGLTEWLTITLFMLFCCAYLKNKKFLAVCLLALVPFVRQNLLIASLLIFFWLLTQWPGWWKYAVCYLLLLMLPVYHNLYYAGEWKFLSTYYNKEGYLVLESGDSLFLQIIKTFFYKILSYTGIGWATKNFWANAVSVLCIPLGTYLYIRCIQQLKGKNRQFFLALTLSAILPTLILGGNAYYPRFEWTNLMIAFLFYGLLVSKKLEEFSGFEDLPAGRQGNDGKLIPTFS
ncbi:MAG TPA: hypothetical protein VIS75_08210 [Chitinophagaceae bacterium]